MHPANASQAARLGALSLPDDVNELLDLPDARSQPFESMTTPDLQRIADSFAQMVGRYLLWPNGAEAAEDASALLSGLGEERFATLGARLSEYFLRTAFLVLAETDTSQFRRTLRPVERPEGCVNAVQLAASVRSEIRFVAQTGVVILEALCVRRDARTPTFLGDPERAFGPLIFSCLKALTSTTSSFGSPQADRLRVVTVEALSNYLWRESKRPQPPSGGPFSRIDLAEIPMLASRAPHLVDKYGERNVDKLFEQQLALLAQSFGFYVVQTRSGKRQVDLVCVSSDPNEPYTILIEAKSTQKPYSLPAADQRALTEYADDVRRNLVTLPPLSVVLLVGSECASTVEAKLNVLEGRIGIPTRFITAFNLASLRDKLPGPAPAGAFRVLAIEARERVLPPTFPDAVAQAYAKRQAVQATFVEDLLDLRHPAWPDAAD